MHPDKKGHAHKPAEIKTWARKGTSLCLACVTESVSPESCLSMWLSSLFPGANFSVRWKNWHEEGCQGKVLIRGAYDQPFTVGFNKRVAAGIWPAGPPSQWICSLFWEHFCAQGLVNSLFFCFLSWIFFWNWPVHIACSFCLCAFSAPEVLVFMQCWIDKEEAWARAGVWSTDEMPIQMSASHIGVLGFSCWLEFSISASHQWGPVRR